MQVGHVHAGNEQQEADCGQQQMQARAHVAAGHGDIHVIQQDRAQLALRIVLRALRSELDVELIQLLFGGVLRHAGREAHDDREAAGVLRIHAQRQPEGLVGPPAEARRHHADDGPGHVIKRDAAVDHVEIAAEEALPESVTQHHHWRRFPTRSDIVGLDGPPDERLHFEEVESSTGKEDAVEVLWIDTARQ